MSERYILLLCTTTLYWYMFLVLVEAKTLFAFAVDIFSKEFVLDPQASDVVCNIIYYLLQITHREDSDVIIIRFTCSSLRNLYKYYYTPVISHSQTQGIPLILNTQLPGSFSSSVIYFCHLLQAIG